jgi:hypothetical protein
MEINWNNNHGSHIPVPASLLTCALGLLDAAERLTMRLIMETVIATTCDVQALPWLILRLL